MSGYLKGFECLVCREFCPADYEGYLCPACGGNLDAVYDYDEIKKELSVGILKSNANRNMWRYKPLFPIETLSSVPPLEMTMSPLYRYVGLEKDTGLSKVYIKDDTRMPSGSFKDRASSVVMAVAREKKVTTVSCASTGNAGSSWACMGAACGMEVVIFVPASAPRAKIAQLRVYGARIELVDGNYDLAYDLSIADSKKTGSFNRCTGYNPYTREGKKSVSYEIWEDLGYKAPGSVFVPAGDGNIISGVWKGFRDLLALGLIEKMPVLFASQSKRSDAITRMIESAEGDLEKLKVSSVSATTIADSISVDTPRDGYAAARAVIETGGQGVRVADEKIIESIWEIASRIGVFAEPAAATSVAALKEAVKSGIEIPTPAVCLITGNGLKDVDAVL